MARLLVQLACVGALASVLAVRPAAASERRFTYTYESGVLNPGDRELEPWTTLRLGRDGAYARFDERIEFEMGLIDRLQAAWYLNFGGLARGSGEERRSEFEFRGVSLELKYKLLDPVADPLGLALYFELGGGPSEVELEGKLILDKRIGNVLLAFNGVVENEWEAGPLGTVRELVLELDAGVAYLMTSGLALGVELRNHNEFVDGAWEHSAFFMGPALSYSSKSWWAAISVTPQIVSPHGATHGSLTLHEHERLEVRTLFGWHL